MSAPTPRVHFNELRPYMSLAANAVFMSIDDDPRVLARELRALEARDLARPAALGWLAQLRCFGRRDRMTVYTHTTWGMVVRADPTLADAPHPHRLLCALVDAAFDDAGDAVFDLVCQIEGLPAGQRFGVWRAVLLALGDVLASDEDRAIEPLLTVQLLGGAATTAQQWEQVPLLYELCMSLTPQGEHQVWHMLGALEALDRDTVTAAMVCAVQALRLRGEMPDRLSFSLPDGRRLVIGPAAPLTGLGLTYKQMAIVWAWRMVLILDDPGTDPDTATRIRQMQETSGVREQQFTVLVTMGACCTLAVAIYQEDNGHPAATGDGAPGGEG